MNFFAKSLIYILNFISIGFFVILLENATKSSHSNHAKDEPFGIAQ